MQNKTNDLTLKEVFEGFRQHRKIIISTTIIGLLCGLILSLVQVFYYSYNNAYTAQVSMVVNSKTKDGDYVGGKSETPDVADIALSKTIASTSEFIARSERIYNTIKKDLNLDMSYEAFEKSIHIQQYEDTQILKLMITLEDADTAVLIANEITKVLPDTLQSTMDIGSVNVIDNSLKAEAVHNGFSPLFIFVGLILGALSSLIWSILYTSAFPKINSSDDVEKVLELETFAEIPHQSSNEKQEYLTIQASKISLPFVENYGTLTAIVQTEMKRKNLQSIMVTSSLENEGKSTIVVNLAQALAAMGKRVLIVDCDIRKPTINRVFALTKYANRSLNAVMNNEITFNEAVIKINKNLSVMQSFPSTKMILTEQFNLLVNTQREKYDFIIMDTPPIGLIADAFQLNGCADAVLFVIKQGYVTEKMARYSMKQLLKSGVPTLGAVLNDVYETKRQKMYYKKYYHRSYLNDSDSKKVELINEKVEDKIKIDA